MSSREYSTFMSNTDLNVKAKYTQQLHLLSSWGDKRDPLVLDFEITSAGKQCLYRCVLYSTLLYFNLLYCAILFEKGLCYCCLSFITTLPLSFRPFASFPLSLPTIATSPHLSLAALRVGCHIDRTFFVIPAPDTTALHSMQFIHWENLLQGPQDEAARTTAEEVLRKKDEEEVEQWSEAQLAQAVSGVDDDAHGGASVERGSDADEGNAPTHYKGKSHTPPPLISLCCIGGAHFGDG